MGIVIIVLIVIGILATICSIRENPIKKIHKELVEDYLKYGYNYIDSFPINYIGGINNISVNNKISFTITKEGLLLLYSTGSNNCIGYSKEKLIKWDSIEDISFQNETSIKEQVSLGKLFVFGVLAFGMKGKKKNINNEYLVLKINEDNEIYNIILQADNKEDNQRKYNELIEYIDKFKEVC